MTQVYPKIKTFTDVYKAGEIGEGVDTGDMPVAFWTVDGPSKPVIAWQDDYSHLDGNSRELKRVGIRKTKDGSAKGTLTYLVQTRRIMDQPGKWGVVVSNVTKGNTSVKGLLDNVGKASTLKELLGKLWVDSSFTNPYPGSAEDVFTETKYERKCRVAHFELFTKPEMSGFLSNV